MKYVFFLVGIVLLIGVEIARVYYIMPFPGSQEENTIELAYFIHNYIIWFRILGLLLIAYPTFLFITQSKAAVKWTAMALLGFWLIVAYAFNFRFLADKMFYQPENKILVKSAANQVSEKHLVLGVFINGEAKAYPIEIIGYHHQVRDTVGGESVMVTYCTVCRTGRVFSPFVNGEAETFRLVGMDHFNAMFEDSRTGSWWRQVNGEAIVGPQKGKLLKEIPSQQVSLKAWLTRYPDSFILQPDSSFLDQYKGLEEYDEGTIEGSLEGTDSLSWKDKSWVVGVSLGLFSRAYDWNDLKELRVINDHIEGTPLLIALESDSVTFHVWSRSVGGDTLQFIRDEHLNVLEDTRTHSQWDWNGVCQEGELKGQRLIRIQSYQEFWHSWRTFQPHTTKFEDAE